MTEQNADQLKQELLAIKNYLIAAQDVMKAGNTPDLKGFESRIANLCESIKSAPQEIQKECLPELMVLLNHLDTCAADMKAAPPPGSTGSSKQ